MAGEATGLWTFESGPSSASYIPSRPGRWAERAYDLGGRYRRKRRQGCTPLVERRWRPEPCWPSPAPAAGPTLTDKLDAGHFPSTGGPGSVPTRNRLTPGRAGPVRTPAPTVPGLPSRTPVVHEHQRDHGSQERADVEGAKFRGIGDVVRGFGVEPSQHVGFGGDRSFRYVRVGALRPSSRPQPSVPGADTGADGRNPTSAPASGRRASAPAAAMESFNRVRYRSTQAMEPNRSSPGSKASIRRRTRTKSRRRRASRRSRVVVRTGRKRVEQMREHHSDE